MSHFYLPKLQKPQFGGGAAVIVFEVSKMEREVCHYTLQKGLGVNMIVRNKVINFMKTNYAIYSSRITDRKKMGDAINVIW